MEGLGCLIIDLQDPFLKVIPNRDEIEKRTSFVLEACQLLGIKTYFSEQVPEKLGATLDSLKNLAPEAPAFGKNAFSAWQIPELQDALKSDEITHLLIGGIETPICVYQTVIQACNDDMPVTLLSDCIGCRRTEDADPILTTLRNNNALLLPSETVFYSILRDVKHPQFREFTKLVKKYS